MTERISDYFENEIKDKRTTFGLDGFVDEVWQVLAKRTGRTDYVLFERMRDFAKSVYDIGEGGYANEIIRKRRSNGGFVTNTGNAAGRLGANPTFVGMFGKNNIDPVFEKFKKAYNLISVADPAICQIFEFTDGKLMLPYIEVAMDFTWEALCASIPWEKLAAAMDADIVAIGYWSQLPDFDNIITGLCKNFLIGGRCKRLFYDFADLRKRDRKSLEQTLKILASFNDKIPMSLSLNEHEAGLLFSYNNQNFDWGNPESACENIAYVHEKIGLDELIVHTPYFAVAATAMEGVEVVMQRYCNNPVITTGAGDNFNGGYIAASLAGTLTLKERLLVGNAATGFYIRNGYSPDKSEMLSEINI